MNKKSLFFLVILIFCFWISDANAESYYYDSIDVEIYINSDSTFDVVETQTYNLNGSFGYFYRDIELKDLDHISNVEVFDSDGNEIFKYDKKYKGNRLHIQWDFPRRDFTNELKSWTVKYKVHGGLGFFDNHDEIYWNAIFHHRDAIVKQAEILVYLPVETEIRPRIFVGQKGSKNENNNYEIIDSKTVRFSGSNIFLNQYLTIVVSWPKGIIHKPFLYRNQLINLIVSLIALLIPLFVLIKSFRIWLKKGKDSKIKKTIIAFYSQPDGLSPASVGVLIKQTVSIKEVLATTINLAVRGYLKIKEQEKKILFIKNKEYIFEKLKSENDLKSYEQKIMKAIFKKGNTVSSTELRNKFYKELPEIKKEIYSEVAQEGLFNGNIKKVRSRYGRAYIINLIVSSLIILGLIVLINVLGLSIYTAQLIVVWIGLIMASIIGLLFSHYMPTITKTGLDFKWKSLGFKEYLHTAERFRIGAETLETFSRFLPYAIIFGVEKQWAKRFSDFSYQQQSWYYPAAIYSGSGGMPSSFGEFSSSFSSFASSLSSTFSSAPGGSGTGGGAGGGGGGGGGGAG